MKQGIAKMIQSRNMHREFLLGFFLLLLVITVRLPSINLPLDNDSGSNAYSARLIVQGEPLYGTHHPGHHLPAVYYTYAAIFALFGDQPASLKIFLIFWVWINALFLYSLGKQLSNRIAGILAAVFFILVTSMTILNGDSAEAELFANLPLTAACWLAIRSIKNQVRPIGYFLVGVISALGFLYKSVYLTSLAAVGATLFLFVLLNRQRQDWIRFIRQCALILTGFLLPVALTFAYFVAVGLGQRLLLVFQYGLTYVGINNRAINFSGLYIPLVIIISICAALAVICILGTAHILIRLPKTISKNRQEGLPRFLVVAWLISSWAAAGASGFGFSHYALILVPPLSLVAGVEIGDLWSRIRRLRISSSYGLQFLLPTLMAIAVIINSLYVSKDYYIGYVNYLSGRTTFNDFISQNAFLGPANLEAVQVARYIDLHTSKEDRILTWTELAQICYLADRRSSSDVLWPRYVPLLGPPQRILDPKPSYIVLYPYPSNSEEGKYTEWLTQEIKPNYILEATIVNSQIYRLVKP